MASPILGWISLLTYNYKHRLVARLAETIAFGPSPSSSAHSDQQEEWVGTLGAIIHQAQRGAAGHCLGLIRGDQVRVYVDTVNMYVIYTHPPSNSHTPFFTHQPTRPSIHPSIQLAHRKHNPTKNQGDACLSALESLVLSALPPTTTTTTNNNTMLLLLPQEKEGGDGLLRAVVEGGGGGKGGGGSVERLVHNAQVNKCPFCIS